MLQVLQMLYPKEWEDIVLKYIEAVDNYVMREYRLKNDYKSVRGGGNGIGKTMYCMILSLYGGLRYDDIAKYGDMSNRQVVYHFLVQGYGYAEHEKGFKTTFSKFRAEHKKIVDWIFNIQLEDMDGYEEERIEDIRITSDYMYASISGVPMRLSLKQWKAMGKLAVFVHGSNNGRMISKKDLFKEKLDRGLE